MKKKKNERTEFEQALLDVRGKLSTQQRKEMKAWAKKESPNISDASLYMISIGGYISNDNMPFAIKFLEKSNELAKTTEEAKAEVLDRVNE